MLTQIPLVSTITRTHVSISLSSISFSCLLASAALDAVFFHQTLGGLWKGYGGRGQKARAGSGAVGKTSGCVCVCVWMRVCVAVCDVATQIRAKKRNVVEKE